jgi:hypothetical protein
MEKIDLLIKSEFKTIRNEVNTQLEAQFDINQKKEFLATYIPKEIIFRSKALVETLINYKNKEAINYLEKNKYDIKVQNKFFEADFKTRIKNLTDKLDLVLIEDSDELSYSRDPRLMKSMIAGGSIFVLGSALSAGFFKDSKLSAFISGSATILLSVLAYRLTYNNFSEQARQKIHEDVYDFITKSEKQIKEWLNNIDKLFDEEFNQFLEKHKIK